MMWWIGIEVSSPLSIIAESLPLSCSIPVQVGTFLFSSLRRSSRKSAKKNAPAGWKKCYKKARHISKIIVPFPALSKGEVLCCRINRLLSHDDLSL
uniref:Uncharacterized protein n=1 Tax=Ditylenchus dipsaci TaxID=166011 RepID=A0A915EGU4_9BILA